MISACLLGENCKYNGGNNRCQWVVDFAKSHSYVPVCPETQAGLPAPRPPAEICGNKVLDSEGQELTEAFAQGAEASWEPGPRKRPLMPERILKGRFSRPKALLAEGIGFTTEHFLTGSQPGTDTWYAC